MDWIGLVGSESNNQSVGNQGSVTQLLGQLKMLSQMDVYSINCKILPKLGTITNRPPPLTDFLAENS